MLKKIISSAGLIILVLLTACGTTQNADSGHSSTHESSSHESMDHMESDDDQTLDLQEANNPNYKKGSKITLLNGHMAGMKNAKGTVEAVYTTHVYSVSYKPITGGKPVRNHKWVVQEELATKSNALLPKGTKVKLKAGHMEGMNGATATIDSGSKTNVYRVSYTDTNTGKLMKHHQWMREDELKKR
ncbi:YdhK family protein [Sporolactobacillus shoreicorticis]|uniref:YdhK family protein n=1 Tax=Sporolactobacillus shoreicorticis TaxID=1923877 RepID=A0ABW5S4W8_9BACL|nr:YdhK family protein [Sporolactobacillus shoreicorticis]MCO7124425.1 YdhK family protein [Sporolactobacillus shoreicorticis]